MNWEAQNPLRAPKTAEKQALMFIARQCMYLGVATFPQERVNEFLNVARDLEIKEISNIVELEEDNVTDNTEKTNLELRMILS